MTVSYIYIKLMLLQTKFVTLTSYEKYPKNFLPLAPILKENGLNSRKVYWVSMLFHLENKSLNVLKRYNSCNTLPLLMQFPCFTFTIKDEIVKE
jgi:hypothetical protein